MSFFTWNDIPLIGQSTIPFTIAIEESLDSIPFVKAWEKPWLLLRKALPFNFQRIGQELKSNVDTGRSYFAEPNLIVLPEVTTKAIKTAVEGLARDGFFQHLKNSA